MLGDGYRVSDSWQTGCGLPIVDKRVLTPASLQAMFPIGSGMSLFRERTHLFDKAMNNVSLIVEKPLATSSWQPQAADSW